METYTIGERLLELKNRAGLSLTAIARYAGYSGASSVQAFFHPAYDPPGLDIVVARKLARSLVGRGDPEITEAELFALLGVKIEQPTLSSTRRNDLDADIPVYETRRWVKDITPTDHTFGIGLMILNRSRPVRYYPRTSGLAWADNAFAMHVTGTAMSPRFEDGEPIFLSGSREAAAGDDVLISFIISDRTPAPKDMELIAIARLVNLEKSATILQFGGLVPKRAAIPVQSIRSLERVSPWAEVCGLPYA